MKQVAIVTDTTACVPPERVADYDIEIVPVQLIIDGKNYQDGVDITPAEFYSRLRQAKKTPTTSSSSPEPYHNAFIRASRRGNAILCLTEPARFSAMYDSARVAAAAVRETGKDTPIEVMECTTAAAGLGLVVIAAARSAASNASPEEAKKTARDVMSRVRLYAALETLQYLARSGRVPQAAALVNSILNIKPVFHLNNGEPHTVSLPRTMKGALEQILKRVANDVIRGQPIRAAVMHADAPELAGVLKERLAARFNCREIYITEFTPVMGVHTGPGLVGVAFYPETQVSETT